MPTHPLTLYQIDEMRSDTMDNLSSPVAAVLVFFWGIVSVSIVVMMLPR